MVRSTIEERGKNGLFPLGNPLKASYMGDTVAKNKNHVNALSLGNSWHVIVRQHWSSGEAQGAFTREGLKCADGGLTHEGAAQGASDYHRNDKIKSRTFPLSPFICTAMYLQSSVGKIRP